MKVTKISQRLVPSLSLRGESAAIDFLSQVTMRSLEVKIMRRSFASNISDGLVNLAFKRGFSSHKATGDGPDTSLGIMRLKCLSTV